MFLFFVFCVNKGYAQIYRRDNIKIEIGYKNKFSVKDFKDLDICIAFSSMSDKKSEFIYERLISSYRSTFGNCYFELYKYDTIFGWYRNITFDIVGNEHPPKEFRNEEEILRYDLKKSLVKSGEKKVLTFNLLNFIPVLSTGEYSMKLFLRTSNIFGFEKDGRLISNSIIYLESTIMNFKVQQTIYTPNRIK